MERREKRICHLNEVAMEVTHAAGKQACGREGEGSFWERVRKSEVAEKHSLVQTIIQKKDERKKEMLCISESGLRQADPKEPQKHLEGLNWGVGTVY